MIGALGRRRLLRGAAAGLAAPYVGAPYVARAQVKPDRLVFAHPLPNAEHLARYRHADLVLDTLPYNAHTTMSDALWMGVPAVTCAGDSFAGRGGRTKAQQVSGSRQIY